MLRKAALLACITAGLLVTACGGDPGARVIAVPSDAATVQDAVDDARPGDIVEVSPGTYRESVKVTTDGIVIRGTDRNAVVLDGGHTLANGIYVAADGVRVENLTVHSYTQNGVVFNGIDAASGTGGVDPDTAFAYVMYGMLMVRAGAVRGVIGVFFTPVVATLLGVVFRDESVTALAVTGMLIVLVGAWLTSRPD